MYTVSISNTDALSKLHIPCQYLRFTKIIDILWISSKFPFLPIASPIGTLHLLSHLCLSIFSSEYKEACYPRMIPKLSDARRISGDDSRLRIGLTILGAVWGLLSILDIAGCLFADRIKYL